MPRERKSQTEVLELIETRHIDVQVEADREWLWVTTDLAPLHKKCDCAECKERATKRTAVKEIGFRFAFKPHPLPSGHNARWGCSCLKPLPFRKHTKGNKPITEAEPEREGNEDAEADAFFNQ